MEIPWPALLMLVSGLLIYTMVICADAALALTSHADVRRRAERGESSARAAETVFRQKRRWLATAVLLRIAALLTAGAALARLLAGSPSWIVIGLGAVGAWLLFAVAQLAGRVWVQADPVRSLLRFAPAMRVSISILSPITALLSSLTARLKDAAVREEDSIVLSDDGVRLVLPNDGEDTEIEESEKEMITSILEMDETVVREVMVPRIDMVAVEADVTLGEALDVILDAGHSRIPVYDDTVDQIIGLLYAKDLLKCFQQQRADALVRDVLRPAYFVPLTKNVKHLLAEMRKHRVHIAIVVDEYGGTAGLVTIEDILEEIVGEIQDEYDSIEEILVQRNGADSFLIAARLDVYSLGKLLDIAIDDEDADTVGGFLLALFGRVPEAGESVDYEGWRFTVLTLDGRRIDKVRVEPIHRPSTPSADAGAAERMDAKRSASGSMRLSPSDN